MKTRLKPYVTNSTMATPTLRPLARPTISGEAKLSNTLGTTMLMAASIKIERWILAPLRLLRITPMREAFTTSVRPSRKAISEMMSSGALPTYRGVEQPSDRLAGAESNPFGRRDDRRRQGNDAQSRGEEAETGGSLGKMVEQHRQRNAEQQYLHHDTFA